MTDFIIKQMPYDLRNQASLALSGKYLKCININSLVDPAFLAWARCAYASQRAAKAYSHGGAPSSAGAPKKSSHGQEAGKRVLFLLALVGISCGSSKLGTAPSSDHAQPSLGIPQTGQSAFF
jgi:hypothetical protein